MQIEINNMMKFIDFINKYTEGPSQISDNQISFFIKNFNLCIGSVKWKDYVEKLFFNNEIIIRIKGNNEVTICFDKESSKN